jgi:hypothetical protein
VDEEGRAEMTKKYIEDSWQGYRKLLSPNAGEVQVAETRQAFYAGAAVLFKGIMIAMDPGEEPTQGDMELMDSINQELQDFSAELDKKVFGG